MNRDTVIRAFLLVAGNALALLLALLALQTVERNALGWFLFGVGIAYMAGGAFAFWMHDHRESPGGARTVGRSLWWMIPGLSAILYGPPLEYRHLPAALPRGLEAQIAGFGFIGLGLSLGVWVYFARRGIRSGRAPVVPGRLPVSEGPYRWVRHPGYLSLLLLALGLAIGYSSVIGLLAIPLLLLPGLVRPMRAEEERLLGAFGEVYRSYCMRTKRVVPGIW